MSSNASALPAGYALNEYRVESVLGVGGFGVTYLATDTNLNLKVALKEYLPVDFAARAADQSVGARTPEDQESFDWGLRRFLDEARTLASFRHPNIVRVMRFFEANRTGYMVMEFVEGDPLHAWMVPRRPLQQRDVLNIVTPLLGGLAVVHKAAYLHRDIKPANIFMRSDGSPVLIDFGSAREIKGGGQEVTAMVSPGYAPLEQYHAQGNQGPWSDLYALGGVMYWMVTGNRPLEASARVRKDTMPPAASLQPAGLYTTAFLSAIDWALKPNEDERPQNTLDFLSRLGDTTAPAMSADAAPTMLPDATLRPAAAQPATGSITTVAVASGFDPSHLKRIEAEAARHLGPIAPVIVRNAARKAATLAALCDIVAQDIEDEKARAVFLKKCADAERTSPPITQPPTRTQTAVAPAHAVAPAQSVSSKFTPEMLKRAETELARHIGAIAGVVVRRAAAKARDEAELYLLIADEIQDPVEKKAFVRKAVIASRPR